MKATIFKTIKCPWVLLRPALFGGYFGPERGSIALTIHQMGTVAHYVVGLVIFAGSGGTRVLKVLLGLCAVWVRGSSFGL